jgi:hypothetical protein
MDWTWNPPCENGYQSGHLVLDLDSDPIPGFALVARPRAWGGDGRVHGGVGGGEGEIGDHGDATPAVGQWWLEPWPSL